MIKPYSHEEHFELLKRWNDAREQYGLEEWMLPKFGLVAHDRAAAFLVTTDSPVAWIAHWTVAPELTKEERDLVIEELARALEAIAREKGFRLLQTLGKFGHNLSDRLRAHGFFEAEGAFTFFAKSLDKGD